MSDGKIVIDTKIDSSGAENGVKSLGGKLGGLAKGGIGLLTKGVKLAGTALAGFGAYAVKCGMDFESGMSKVQAISGATGEDLEKLTAKAKEMGAKTKFSATESSQAMQYMGMAGWKTQEMLDGLPAVMNLAAASGEDLATTSDIVTDALTAFGLKAKDASHFSDVLAAASTNSNTTVSMLGESFKYVAPLAGSMGYSVEDMSTVLGLMANNCIKGSQAGTSLRSIISRMAKPTAEVSVAMDKLGVSLTDSQGNVKPFRKVVDELRTSMKGLSKSEQIASAAAIAGKPGMNGLLAIINSTDEDINKLSGSITNCEGAADKMAETMNDNLSGQFTLLKSATEGLGISLYENVDNPLKDVVKSASGMVNQLNDALTKNGFEGFINEIGNVLSQVITGIVSKIPDFINAGIMIVKGLIKGIKENLPLMTMSIVEGLSDLLNAAISMLPEFLDIGMQAITNFVNGLAQKAPLVISVATKSVKGLIDTFIKNLPLLLGAGIKLLQALIKGIVQALPQIIPAVIECIKQLITTIIDNLPLILDAGMQLLQALVDGILQAIPLLLEMLPTVIQNIVDFIAESLPMILERGSQILLSIIDGIVQAIPKLIEMLPKIIETIINFLTKNLPQIVEMGVKTLQSLINGLVDAIPKLIEMLPQITNTIMVTITEHLGDIIKAAIQIMLTLATGMVENIPKIIAKIPQIVKSIFNAFAETNWAEIGINIIKGVAEGLVSLPGYLWDKAKSVAGDLKDGFCDFFDINSPSRVMRDLVGVNIIKGIGVGMDKETSKLNDASKDNMHSLYSALRGTVDIETAKTTTSIANTNIVNNYTNNTTNTESESLKDKIIIHNVTNVDGRVIAEATTPYIDNNLGDMQSKKERGGC